ncbi:helix-turn-helix transcriptional regulator [Acidomonas methanolica]|uniref:Transcriptional regulator AraC n=2 Tax=Acidomonas methanolica TaxID=437 RepID=A0A023D9F9_ACIMT|nr:AraC family transcriptional regulator [Acidomonas methanolica]GAJ30782.1 transcriptional regulator AraC [Acidomonas methanolica NBRC 104435]GBQ46219.1 AraC family transcriptional regulator [Acidomonas methanolica]GEL00713.1 AraC family transcriptional regulator [Acidomonas methanolica NBRC 104435]
MRTDRLSVIRISSQSIRIMCAVLRESNIDAAGVMAEAHVDPSVLTDPKAEIDGNTELQFQRAFIAVTRHIPGLWMRTGLRYRVMSYGPLGLAVLAAANVAEGLEVMGTFQALTFSLMFYCVEYQDGAPIALLADDSHAPEEYHEFLQERALGAVTMFLNDMQPPRFPIVRIESRLHRPPGWENCEAVLGAPVLFDAPTTRWVFAPGAGSLPLPMASPVLEETYRDLCAQLIDAAPNRDELLSRLYEVMVRSSRGFPDARSAASALGISERSLHRWLAARGTSFGTVVDQVRFQRAQEMLTKSALKIDRIAEMLGFAETASFSRAFKRWSGMPPTAFRVMSR